VNTFTDDADRCELATFDECPVGDRDIMNDEWEMACGMPKCGGRSEFSGYGGCNGCRHCDPPQCDSKPYGWGIESFEDPALQRANEEVKRERERTGFGMYTSAFVSDSWLSRGALVSQPWGWWIDRRDFLWRSYSRHDKRREAKSNRVWDRLCDECATHAEAVEKYTAWAERAASRSKLGVSR
jgi:hypothetical protein